MRRVGVPRVEVRRVGVRRLGTAGLVGVSFFAVVTVLLPLAQQPDHDVVRSSISALALGSWGWLQAAAFAVLGVGTVAIALVLHGSRLGRLGPGMVVVSGLLDLVIAVFPTAPDGAAVSGVAAVHAVAATGSLVLMVHGETVRAGCRVAAPSRTERGVGGLVGRSLPCGVGDDRSVRARRAAARVRHLQLAGGRGRLGSKGHHIECLMSDVTSRR